MNLQQWTDYCLSKPYAEQDFPFDADTISFKVGGKIFSLTSLKRWEAGDHSVNLKCDPQKALELRERYASVTPGYHMSKKHWNTVSIDEGELNQQEIIELIDHSYALVYQSLSRKVQEELSKS